MHVDFYVYEHWRPDKDVCFYVGKGRRIRAWDMKKRNFAHRALVSKLTSLGLSVDIRIIASKLTEDASYVLEIERIAFYGMNTLVNFTAGGKGPLHRPLSAEARERIRAAHTGRVCSPETRAKLRAINLGKKHSVETRAKISALGKGRHVPEDRRLRIAAANVGKSKSAAHCAALAKAWEERRKGYSHSCETRAKMSIAAKGRPKSATQRANMVLAQRRRRDDERMVG